MMTRAEALAETNLLIPRIKAARLKSIFIIPPAVVALVATFLTALDAYRESRVFVAYIFLFFSVVDAYVFVSSLWTIRCTTKYLNDLYRVKRHLEKEVCE